MRLRGRPRLVRSVSIPVAILACALTVVISSNSLSVAADPPPPPGFFIFGFVYDENGDPLEGAFVVVDVYDQDTEEFKASGQSDIYPTEADGYYEVTSIDSSLLEVGDDIEVTATVGSIEQKNWSVVPSYIFVIIDVHFTTAIPQFGSLLGFAVAAGAVCVVGVAFVSLRRKR